MEEQTPPDSVLSGSSDHPATEGTPGSLAPLLSWTLRSPSGQGVFCQQLLYEQGALIPRPLHVAAWPKFPPSGSLGPAVPNPQLLLPTRGAGLLLPGLLPFYTSSGLLGSCSSLLPLYGSGRGFLLPFLPATSSWGKVIYPFRQHSKHWPATCQDLQVRPAKYQPADEDAEGR